MNTYFCLVCGTHLQSKMIEGRQREICPNCGWIHYEHRKVSAGVRVEKEGCLLLVQRGIDPWYQKWCMPAGYLEVDEEPELAAIREAQEETGLLVRILGLAGIYTYSNDPRGNGIVLLYDAELIGGDFQRSSETLQVGFYSVEEIKKMQFAGASADRQVLDWINLGHHAKGNQA